MSISFRDSSLQLRRLLGGGRLLVFSAVGCGAGIAVWWWKRGRVKTDEIEQISSEDDDVNDDDHSSHLQKIAEHSSLESMSRRFLLTKLGQSAEIMADMASDWSGGMGYYAPQILCDLIILGWLKFRTNSNRPYQMTLVQSMLSEWTKTDTSYQLFTRFIVGVSLALICEGIRTSLISTLPKMTLDWFRHECDEESEYFFDICAPALEDRVKGISDLSHLIWEFVGDEMEYAEYERIRRLRDLMEQESQKNLPDLIMDFCSFYEQRLRMVFDNQALSLCRRYLLSDFIDLQNLNPPQVQNAPNVAQNAPVNVAPAAPPGNPAAGAAVPPANAPVVAPPLQHPPQRSLSNRLLWAFIEGLTHNIWFYLKGCILGGCFIAQSSLNYALHLSPHLLVYLICRPRQCHSYLSHSWTVYQKYPAFKYSTLCNDHAVYYQVMSSWPWYLTEMIHTVADSTIEQISAQDLLYWRMVNCRETLMDLTMLLSMSMVVRYKNKLMSGVQSILSTIYMLTHSEFWTQEWNFFLDTMDPERANKRRRMQSIQSNTPTLRLLSSYHRT